jgi:hypothetical protein
MYANLFTSRQIVSTVEQRRQESIPYLIPEAFDSAGQWKLRTVTDRLDNVYEGPVITIDAGESSIEATIHHPFWVIEGHELHDRPHPRKFATDEDQSKALPGRWVNSHDLRVGDVMICKDGKQLAIRQISQRYETHFLVSNLTIGDFHNYAVGTDSFLVHNESVCDEAVDWLRSLLNAGEVSMDDVSRFLDDYDNAADVLARLAPKAGLSGASGAAFQAAKRIDEFTIPKKHLPGAGGKWAKFADGVDAKSAIKEALESGDAPLLPNSVTGSFKIETPLGRTIGTNGENAIRVIIGEDGKIWTAFPIKL